MIKQQQQRIHHSLLLRLCWSSIFIIIISPPPPIAVVLVDGGSSGNNNIPFHECSEECKPFRIQLRDLIVETDPEFDLLFGDPYSSSRLCIDDTDCGYVLKGSSHCGCTNDIVLRSDVLTNPNTTFYQLMENYTIIRDDDDDDPGDNNTTNSNNNNKTQCPMTSFRPRNWNEIDGECGCLPSNGFTCRPFDLSPPLSELNAPQYTGSCSWNYTSPRHDDGRKLNCTNLESEIKSESSSLQSCTDDEDCGQPITPSLSCGCRSVARTDADFGLYQQIIDEMSFMECDNVFVGCTGQGYFCEGYRCRERDDGTKFCTWDYASTQPNPNPNSKDGEDEDDDSVKDNAASSATTTMVRITKTMTLYYTTIVVTTLLLFVFAPIV